MPLLALALSLAALALSPAAPAAPSADASPRAAARAPSQAAVAKRLAAGVSRARTPAARYRALLPVMRALGLGVYTTRGRPVVRGGERSHRDFYLYDVELRALAGALGRRQTSSPAELAEFLRRSGLAPRIGDEVVRAALHAGVRTAVRTPRDPAALVPLLVRELGLRARPRVDLVRGVPADARLDALQTFLLRASVVVPGARAQARGRRLAAFAGCPEVKPDKEQAQLGDKAMRWWLWKEVKRRASAFSNRVKQGLKVKKLLDNAYYGLHGSTLAYGLKVTRVHNDFETHYGPAGHRPNAGEPLRFQLKVEMLDNLGEQTIRCLALAGVKLPRKGRVEGVPVRFVRGQGDLREHGTLEPALGALGGVAKTDRSGIATLLFTPRSEVVPGLGKEMIEHGTVDALAEWASAFGNKLARFNQYFTPKYDVMGWDVGFHQQWAFDVSIAGSQETAWTHSFDQTGHCYQSNEGSGSQRITFATLEATRVVFFEDEGGNLQLRAAAEPQRADATVRLPASVHRSGKMTVTRFNPRCQGTGGGGGGAVAPDCGDKLATLFVQLRYGARLELRDDVGESSFPFQNCPIAPGSRYQAQLLAAAADLERARVVDRDQQTIRVSGASSVPENRTHSSSHPVVGTSTSSTTGQTSVQWSITLERVR